jgi:hypothetical protein
MPETLELGDQAFGRSFLLLRSCSGSSARCPTSARTPSPPGTRPTSTSQTEPHNPAVERCEREAFWDWAVLELLVQSGLRIEEACELTTLDVLKRQLPDGRVYYLLHVKAVEVRPSAGDPDRRRSRPRPPEHQLLPFPQPPIRGVSSSDAA